MENFVWIIALVFVPVLLLVLLQDFSDSPAAKGAAGEAAVRSRLSDELDGGTYILFHDLIIPSQNGTTQIDHVCISPYGIFVLETKNYTGWIFGSEKQAHWTQTIYREKHRFQNPLRQNYAHIKALAALLKLPESGFHSVLVFAGDCELKTEMPPNVCRLHQAVGYIRSFQAALLSEHAVGTAAALLSDSRYRCDSEKLSAHKEQLRHRHRR